MIKLGVPTIGAKYVESILRNMTDSPRCSDLQHEPMPGTGQKKKVYVAFEWPGGWSHDVLDGGTFDPELSKTLKQFMADNSAGLQLMRRPGRAGHKSHGSYKVFLAFTDEGIMETLELSAPEDILKLDLSGPWKNPGARRVAHPVLLVCTHGKRDVCCAIKGRPMAAELSKRYPGDEVWESSHTKGHRFAPSIILLPWGYSFGRLGIEAGDGLMCAARRGEYFAPGNRGRGLWSPQGQVAEVAVAEKIQREGAYLRFSELMPEETDHPTVWKVHYPRAARSFTVCMEQREVDGILSSCGDDPKTSKVWVATEVHEN